MGETTCGTPEYIAPEILKFEPYDQRCDYWSLGVLMFIMLSGEPPFVHSSDNFVLFEIIKSGKFKFSAPVWQQISKEAKHLISRLLTVDP